MGKPSAVTVYVFGTLGGAFALGFWGGMMAMNLLELSAPIVIVLCVVIFILASTTIGLASPYIIKRIRELEEQEETNVCGSA